MYEADYNYFLNILRVLSEAGINVTGEDISKIKYSIMGDDSDVIYNLARMKEVDKDSPEYQTSSDKFRKQTANGYAYYIVEDIGEE